MLLQPILYEHNNHMFTIKLNDKSQILYVDP